MERTAFSAAVAGGTLVGLVGGAGREVLLLHGGPGLGHDILAGLPPELEWLRVATYQQRGLAPSTAREPYDVDVQVADVVAVLDTLGRERPVVLGHSWGGHLLLHLIASRPDRVSAALVVDPLGAVGDGGMGRFEAELTRRTPDSDRERTAEIDERAMTGEATESELLESLRLVWPAYFSTPERAGSMPPIGLSIEAYTGTCASIVETLPALPGRLLGCTVPTRFVHGGESPMPVAASTETAALSTPRWTWSRTRVTSCGSRRRGRCAALSTRSTEIVGQNWCRAGSG